MTSLRIHNRSTTLCILSYIIIIAIMSVRVHSSPSTPSSQSTPSSKSSTTAGATSIHDYDPDEIEGIPDSGPLKEIVLDDDEQHQTDITPTKSSSTSNPADDDDGTSTRRVTIPANAFDKERIVKRLDWIHIQYEVRQMRRSDDDDDDDISLKGRLLYTTRKLGRQPFIFQVGSTDLLPGLEDSLPGSKIGERKSITLDWTSDDVYLTPNFANSDQLESGARLQLTYEIIRFDLDEKELTWEDR